MTTSALTSADQIHLTRRSTSRRGVTSAIKGKQTFARSLRSEWLKLVSLRSTWVTSAITVAVMVLFGASTAVGYHGVAEKADEAKYEITSGAPFGYIVVAVLAALLVTSEYASGQIRSTLTATPPPRPSAHGQGRGRRGLRLRPGSRVDHGDLGCHPSLPQG
ncbi:hypothetical protein SAMN05216246_11358 [Actinomyces denticolens]|uniref:ABC transport system permease protein n=1 Tax=Actinomyces denticolens TaxID=52767 RepID=A0ABY1IHF1_9ACTO|nr:hypothetical protein [Actinomyces denticolens]SHJ17401.1 hypothetical protein SAMN05216246_11358 [Actinomyces denticolens]